MNSLPGIGQDISPNSSFPMRIHCRTYLALGCVTTFIAILSLSLRLPIRRIKSHRFVISAPYHFRLVDC